MGITLAFRVGFFCVSFLTLVYSRTFVTSSLILAVSGWLFFGHPEDNSTGQEFIVFFWTWAAAAFVAWIVCPHNLLKLEVALFDSTQRAKLGSAAAINWALGMLAGILAYAAIEAVGYDISTFRRLQSLIWIFLLWLGIYVIDAVQRKNHYHFFPFKHHERHSGVLTVLVVALLLDIMLRDANIYRWMLPAMGVVGLVATARLLIYNKWLVHERALHTKHD